jgi:hypothetical protein
MSDTVTITIPRGAAAELDRLLNLVKRAGEEKTGLTFEDLQRAGMTNGGMGTIHHTLLTALAHP